MRSGPPEGPRYTGSMPNLLESGNLRLSLEEGSIYRSAADRLYETGEMVLDLRQPVTVDEWMFLEVTHAALEGDLELLDGVIAKVEAEIQSRKQPD